MLQVRMDPAAMARLERELLSLVEVEVEVPPLVSLDSMLVHIARYLSAAGYGDEVHKRDDMRRAHSGVLPHTQRLRLLADYRLLMLQRGFPLEEVAHFDR